MFFAEKTEEVVMNVWLNFEKFCRQHREATIVSKKYRGMGSGTYHSKV